MAKQYIIIGGGPAASNAVETIRQMETEPSAITLISDEPAHSRMALPYWLAGSIDREKTLTGDESYFQKLAVTPRWQRVASVDAESQAVVMDDGTRLDYDRLLISTGSSPLQPEIPGADLPGVQPLWTLAHTEAVLRAADQLDAPRVVLVGAGFIGFIMLNAMFKRGWNLQVVERELQVLPRMLSSAAVEHVENWLEFQRVGVHTGVSVQAIEETSDGGKRVQLSDGKQLEADIVVLGIGVRPNIELAADAGIDVDHGILVNDQMQTSRPNIYAAGDVAQGPQLLSGETAVHAIQPTAVDHGRVAGANMAGSEVHYGGSLLMNVVDVCGLQCASFGHWNAMDAEETTISNAPGRVFRRLVWDDGRLAGAEFVGRPNDMGMLTDVGMVKGMIQTQAELGPWKQYLQAHPFDVRRTYIATGVATKLINHTLLGRPTRGRGFQAGQARPAPLPAAPHATFVGTKEDN